MIPARLTTFLRESNAIEGIYGGPGDAEIAAARRFLELPEVNALALGDFQTIIAPGKPLREHPGMNVQVGNYLAPPGGPNILRRLQALLRRANEPGSDPWETHCRYETLHPYLDGNGRTGRLLWAWQTHRVGRDPFIRPFLQSFYYETLEHQRR
jgi:Fic/DOC family